MEVILLGIYSFFVWLIFIKLKLLPWTTPWKVGVAIFPVVVIAIMLLCLNVFAPTTTDVRVVRYVVPIVSQVRGRVIEVPVENNRPVKKGDVLFKIDPTPYQNEVASLKARLASEEAKVGSDRTRLTEAQAKLPDAVSGEKQLKEQQNAAAGQVRVLQASLQLAQTRVKQNSELVKTGAGPRFDLEQAQTNVDELNAQIAAARAAEQQVKEKLDGRVMQPLPPHKLTIGIFSKLWLSEKSASLIVGALYSSVKKILRRRLRLHCLSFLLSMKLWILYWRKVWKVE